MKGGKMRRIYAIILTFTLFISSCTVQQQDPVSSSGEGKLLFKIAKENAPTSVIMITMKLTRSGFTPISGNLNLLSDSTAELLVEGIPEGVWHLKVDGLNNNNLVVYTGETDVEVQANFISQVNLTLNPSSTGLGSIQINVNWGVTPVVTFPFKDYANNPILLPGFSVWDNDIRDANVIFDEGKYKMYYTSLKQNGQGAISYAESMDGLTWTRPYPQPLIYPGGSNTLSWDAKCITSGAIIKNDGMYYLFFHGFSDPYGPWGIGLATSMDGINWVKRPNPILGVTSGDEYQIIPTSVIRWGNQFLLYYTTRNYPSYKTCVATSTDLINWTKYPGNPIVTASAPWEGIMVSSSSVIADGDSLLMVYSSLQGNKTYFGIATSTDGFTWVKSATPVFSNQATSQGWASSSIDYCNLIKTPDKYLIYYGGYKSNQTTRIGVTIKDIL